MASSARRRRASRPAELVEVAAIRQAGQGIGRRLHLGCAMRASSRERGRRLERRADEQASRRGRPRSRAPARQHDGADHAVARPQRCREHVGQPIGATHLVGDPVAPRAAPPPRSSRAAAPVPAGRDPIAVRAAVSPDRRPERSPSAASPRRRQPSGSSVPRRPTGTAAAATAIRASAAAPAMTGTATSGRDDGARSSTSRRGSSVVDGGTPGRALISVAWRACASGRRRATTIWSAPVELASSSTIAATIASSETDRDRPDRIRAKDSASARRPTLERRDGLAVADGRDPRRPPRAPRGPSPAGGRRRSAAGREGGGRAGGWSRRRPAMSVGSADPRGVRRAAGAGWVRSRRI